ncbi:MAG: DUF3078 domain-containing protein [Ignavibacteria bacterium]|jgi:hypothetical protein
MRKIFVFYFVISSTLLAEKSTDSTKNNINSWEKQLIVGLNVSQIAFSNWVKGGENSVAWTIHSEFNIKYKSKIWILNNEYKIMYGRTKLGKGEFKTIDNEINLESVLLYNAGWVVVPFFGNSIRTQVTTGFNYEKDLNESIVDFFDPGYITQSLGFTYDKSIIGNTRFGIAFQETFTNKHPEYSDDEDTAEIENFKFETGIESVTNSEFLIDTNIKLVSKLRLFSRFENLDIWDVNWNNQFVSKINSYLRVNFDFVLIYEKAQSLKTQIKESFQLGITYNII